MGVYFPDTVSIDRFTGGYKAVSDYTFLGDTETNDSFNTIYGPNGDIDQRPGSRRLYNSRLSNDETPTVGEPITGHYYFDKLGNTSAFNVIGAGGALYNYTSSTAVKIRTGMTDNSNTFWDFIQIQDPRSAADDIVLMTNGSDPIQVWTGSGTASTLASFTSATGVATCKFLLNHKERVYAINIVDTTDSDAPVKVNRSGFGTDGAADPHRFRQSFYVGGSNKQGDIRGAEVLNDQIYFYTRKGVWKFNPGSGDLGDLQELQGSIGLFAPRTLVNTGNFHIFLSEQGVQIFDGVNFKHISEFIDDDLFMGGNLSQLQYATADFDKRNNQYVLYYAHGGSTRNNRALIFDMRPGMMLWQPPITGKYVSTLSHFDDSDGLNRLIYGDYSGYLYEDGKGVNDGLETGYNGTTSASTFSTLTDNGNNFPTAGDGLSGMVVRIIGGTGDGEERVIQSNTSAVITVETPWSILPDTTSLYTVTGIDGIWRSKDFNFGSHDIVKLYRHIRIRTKELGNFNLTLHYIVDFNDLSLATSRAVSLLEDGMAWGEGVWGQDRWGGKETIRRKISLRTTNTQQINGTHLAARFSNRRANENFRVSGFDIELKPLGKR